MTTNAPTTPGSEVLGRRIVARLVDLLPVILLFVALYIPSLDKLSKIGGCEQGPGPDCNVERIEAGVDRNGEATPIYILKNGREIEADHPTVDLFSNTYIADPAPASAFLLPLAYALVVFVVIQGLLGWTPGKLLAGIRLARDDGHAAGPAKALVRWRRR